MALGAYNVIRNKPQYQNVYIAASADGQREALQLIKEGGCTGKYISTGLNSPSLATEDAMGIAVDIATGPATDEIVGPNRRQGFLDGLTAGGVTYEIKSEQNGEYQQDKGQVAAENMLAGNPDTDLVLGLNDCPISLKVAVRPLSLLSLAVSIGTSCCGLSRNTLHFRDHAQDTGHTSWSPKGPASDSPPPPAMESSAPAEAAAYAGRD